ncbi:hypothetical protein CDL15_Pgr015664 [Punica granatum]|uniref:Uncharacterized protein n=1 Tax=Punica granatum TaxID=22663 RepID=A0A218XPL3_PUNGR|nr:hypothetical protein CDL15_Pgr015664 [Punica granatum]
MNFLMWWSVSFGCASIFMNIVVAVMEVSHSGISFLVTFILYIVCFLAPFYLPIDKEQLNQHPTTPISVSLEVLA